MPIFSTFKGSFIFVLGGLNPDCPKTIEEKTTKNEKTNFLIYLYCLIITIPATFKGLAPAPLVWYLSPATNPFAPASASSA